MEVAAVAKTEEKKKGAHAASESLAEPMVSRDVEAGAKAGMPLFLQRAVSSPPSSLVQRQMDEEEEAASEAQMEEESLVEATGIQAKLTVGASDDVYEHEADRVADTVMRMPEPTEEEGEENITPSPLKISRVQRKCEACEEEENEEEEEETVQRKEEGGAAPQAKSSLDARLTASKGSGQPLPESTRGFMESRFGQDFSGVRVHTGNEAAQLNRELRAQAFTHGQDVYFGAGKYGPETGEGKRLLAHELTHVVQQSSFIGHPEIQRTEFGDAIRFETLPGSPRRVRVIGSFPDEAIALELYGNPALPINHVEDISSEEEFIEVDYPNLLPQWIHYFPVRGANEPEPAALRILPGGSLERPIMGTRPFEETGSYLRPLSEENLRVLERVIPGTPIYSLIREHEQKQRLLDQKQQQRQQVLPSGGLPQEGSSESLEVASLDTEIRSLEQEIEQLGTQIQEGLGLLSLERPEQLVALVEEVFPRLFEERAKQIADAELEHNREITEEEATRYGIRRYTTRSTEQIEQDRRALRAAARDLIARDQEIETAQKNVELQQRQQEEASEWRFSTVGRYTPLHTGLSIPVVQLQTEREQQRQAYLLQFPIFNVVEPQIIANASDRELDTAIGAEIDEILHDIWETQINIRENVVKIWDLPMIMEKTKQDLGISSNPVLLAAVDNHIQDERTDELYLNIALTALAITAGIVASIASGGTLAATSVGLALRLVAGGVSLAISSYQLSESVETYLAESAAGNVALARHIADISSREPELAWVIVDLVGFGLDAVDILKALPLLRQANRGLMLGGEIDEFADAARRALPDHPDAAERLLASLRGPERRTRLPSVIIKAESLTRLSDTSMRQFVLPNLDRFAEPGISVIARRLYDEGRILPLTAEAIEASNMSSGAKNKLLRELRKKGPGVHGASEEGYVFVRSGVGLSEISSTLTHEITHHLQRPIQSLLSEPSFSRETLFRREIQAHWVQAKYLRALEDTRGPGWVEGLGGRFVRLMNATENPDELIDIVRQEYKIPLPRDLDVPSEIGEIKQLLSEAVTNPERFMSRAPVDVDDVEESLRIVHKMAEDIGTE